MNETRSVVWITHTERESQVEMKRFKLNESMQQLQWTPWSVSDKLCHSNDQNYSFYCNFYVVERWLIECDSLEKNLSIIQQTERTFLRTLYSLLID